MNIIADMLCTCKNEKCSLKLCAHQTCDTAYLRYAYCDGWPNIVFNVRPSSIDIEFQNTIIIYLDYDKYKNNIIKRVFQHSVIANVTNPECHLILQKHCIDAICKYLNESM